jgi:hypothetical protein
MSRAFNTKVQIGIYEHPIAQMPRTELCCAVGRNNFFDRALIDTRSLGRIRLGLRAGEAALSA